MKRSGLLVGLVLCAAGAAAFGSRLWEWVLNFDPGFAFAHQPLSTGPPLTTGVTLLLVDGLRLDASRAMPTLNALRSRGADIEAEVGTPSFSRPGRATIAVGAPPSIHGVTTNRQKRTLSIDNLIRRVGALGGTCRVAGSKIWSGLFGADLARCGAYRAGEAKEGPGAFVRQVPEVRASQEAGLAFILEQSATLRIADVVSTDFAAHEYGGTSPEYRAELARIDEMIAGLLEKLDLTKETLVVTADHGHRDAGGHGGAEPEVLAIPVVMVGAGIRPSVKLKAFQWDIAPTLAALLGVGIPTGSAGAPMEPVLLADADKASAIRAAALAQREAFGQALASRLELRPGGVSSSDWMAMLREFREAGIARRLPVAFAVSLLVLAFAALAIRKAAPDLLAVGVGVVTAILLLVGPVGSRVPTMSFSAINYDEMLIPFFIRIITLATTFALASLGSALLAGRVFRARPATDTPVEQAASTGLVLSTAIVIVTVGWWWRYLLLEPRSLPGPDQLVEAFGLILSIASVSCTSLVVGALLWLVERRQGSRK